MANITKYLLTHLEADCLLPISDQTFIDLFNQWCKKNNICEYFIIDQNANFLLVDKTGKHSFFVTHTERTLKNLIEMYEDSREALTLLSSIKTGARIPYFGEQKEGWEVDIKEWEKYLYVPTILQGREKYYWTVL